MEVVHMPVVGKAEGSPCYSCDGARKDCGVKLTWEQYVLVRGDDQPVGNPKRKV
jgi:hypothetical protein